MDRTVRQRMLVQRIRAGPPGIAASPWRPHVGRRAPVGRRPTLPDGDTVMCMSCVMGRCTVPQRQPDRVDAPEPGQRRGFVRQRLAWADRDVLATSFTKLLGAEAQ